MPSFRVGHNLFCPPAPNGLLNTQKKRGTVCLTLYLKVVAKPVDKM